MDQNVKNEQDGSLEGPSSENKTQKDAMETSGASPPVGEPASNLDTSGGTDEASRLKELQADIRDQDTLERDITRQADRLLMEQADERDNKRLEKTKHEKEYNLHIYAKCNVYLFCSSQKTRIANLAITPTSFATSRNFSASAPPERYRQTGRPQCRACK